MGLVYELEEINGTDYEVITSNQEGFFAQTIDDWYRQVVKKYQAIPNLWELLNGDSIVTTSHIEWLFDIFVASHTEREYGTDYTDEQFSAIATFLIDVFDHFFPILRRDVFRFLNKNQYQFIYCEYDFLTYDTETEMLEAIQHKGIEVYNSPLQDVW